MPSIADHDSFRLSERARLLGAVWLAYVGGGLFGSFRDGRIKLWSLLIPLGILVVVIAADLRRPLPL